MIPSQPKCGRILGIYSYQVLLPRPTRLVRIRGCTCFSSDSPISWLIRLCVFNHSGGQALGVLDIDGLDVAIELLLGTLLVVTLTGDANTKPEWYALDAGFPDLLVELGINADVLGALYICS
jgi:hypothetical protein